MGNITVTATSPSTVAPVSTSLLSFDGTVASVFHNTRSSAACNDHKLGRRSQSCGDESSEKVARSPSEKGRIQQSQLTSKEATKLGSISSSSSHVVKSVFVQGVGWASQVSSNRNIRELYIQGRERLRVRDLTSSFFAYSQNIDSPESFILLFFTRKVSTVTFSGGGCTLSCSQNDKTSNI